MNVSRRDFLRTSAVVGGSVLALGRSAHAAGSDILKVGDEVEMVVPEELSAKICG